VKTETNNLKVLIIIPCYNEEESISNLLIELSQLKIKGYSITVLPINDSSRDTTLNKIKQNSNVFLDLPINLGIGGTMQTGYQYALRNNFDIAIQLDGDGQHPPTQILSLLDIFKSSVVDVVIGSRFITGEGFQSTKTRRIGIKFLKNLNLFLFKVNITDPTSGFRAINKKALKIVCDYYPDEYPEPEMISIFHLNNLKITEVEVQMEERKGGTSSISSLKSIYYIIKVTLSILFIYIKSKTQKKHES
jgi:glycosyltransferase involved in cell wall biosynthesis